MTLKDQLMEDLKDAMRTGDELKKSTIRMVRAAIKNAEIAKIGELDDAEMQEVLRKEIKQRRESADAYARGKRDDLVDKELAEAKLIESYLPKQKSEEEIQAEVETEVRSIIAEVGATGPKDMGKVMPAAMSRLKGRADGQLINKVVSKVLAE